MKVVLVLLFLFNFQMEGLFDFLIFWSANNSKSGRSLEKYLLVAKLHSSLFLVGPCAVEVGGLRATFHTLLQLGFREETS